MTFAASLHPVAHLLLASPKLAPSHRRWAVRVVGRGRGWRKRSQAKLALCLAKGLASQRRLFPPLCAKADE
jgi:hypothetical protein